MLEDETIRTTLDEQIVYDQLNGNEQAVWSLLLASGYLKVLSYEEYDKVLPGMQPKYEIASGSEAYVPEYDTYVVF